MDTETALGFILCAFGEFAGAVDLRSGTSTVTAIEHWLWDLRDLTLLADDYRLGSITDRAKVQITVQNYGDRNSRQRGTKDLGHAKTFKPMALLASTGEDIWESQACIARTIEAPIAKGDFTLEDLEAFKQTHIHTGALGLVGSTLIRSFARIGVETLKHDLAAGRQHFLPLLSAPTGVEKHERIRSTYANFLALGMVVGETLAACLPRVAPVWKHQFQMLQVAAREHVADAMVKAHESSALNLLLDALRAQISAETICLPHFDRMIDSRIGMPGTTEVGFHDETSIYLSHGNTWEGWYLNYLQRAGKKPEYSWSAVVHEATTGSGGSQRVIRRGNGNQQRWLILPRKVALLHADDYYIDTPALDDTVRD